jgi:MFS family permease
LVDVGHLTLSQLGILAAVGALSSILANIPSGYLADKWTRQSSIITGALLLAAGSASYALSPNFIGAIVAVIFEWSGYAFLSGASEALMHDTLLAMGKINQYVRTMGKALSIGLIGNVVLVGLVPMTYSVYKRLPFIIGALLALLLAYLCSKLVEPPRPARQSQDIKPKNLYRLLRVFVNHKTALLFIALGLLSCAYDSYSSFGNLVLQDLGFNPALLGLVFAGSSIVGAIGGRVVHKIESISLLSYALFDTTVSSMSLVLIGVSHNLIVSICVIVVNIGFWRIRSIVYQDKLLRLFGHHQYKATLVSTIGFFTSINVWMPITFATIITHKGYYAGFVIIGLAMLAIISGLFVAAIRILNKQVVPKNPNPIRRTTD